MLLNPHLSIPFMNAVVALGNLERYTGVSSRYGMVSGVHGLRVSDWPVAIAHELALAEDRVFETSANLREAHGITREMDRARRTGPRAG